MEREILERDEVYALANYPDNYQDAVVFAFVFEGLSLEEISNLKVKDLDKWEFPLELKEDTLKVARNAVDEKYYIHIEGEALDKKCIKESEYVVRDTSGDRVPVEVLESRIKRVLSPWGYKLEVEDIKKSGEIHRGSNQ